MLSEKNLCTIFSNAALSNDPSDKDVFAELKENQDDEMNAQLLAKLFATSGRKQASVFVKTGIVSVTKCFEIWTAVTSRYVSADGENKFSIQEVKILSIAFIWLLEVSAGDEDIIAQLYTGLSFLSSSLKELSSLIGSCAPSEVEVTNEALEQVIKAVATVLRKAHQSCAENLSKDGIDSLKQSLFLLLANSKLPLSKAVLSQCGMAYAGTLPFLQSELVIESVVEGLPQVSFVCVLHGLMVMYSAAQLAHCSQMMLEQLIPLISSQDPVILTLLVRTISLWADIACNSPEWRCIQTSENYSLYNPLIQRLEGAVWDLWETHVEMAKGHLRDIFSSILKLHFQVHKGYDDDQIKSLLERCMTADFEKKKTYHTLQILVDFVPSSYIVTLFPQLPRKLLKMLFDQSKSQVCQMTLVKMVQSHWKQIKPVQNQSEPSDATERQETQNELSINNEKVEFWRETWIDDLLDIQVVEQSESFRVNAGFIQYIKCLFKTDPTSLKFILNRKDLTLVVRLMIIKAAADENLFTSTDASKDGVKVEGESGTVSVCSGESSAETEMWRGMVSMATMYSAVWSSSGQVLQDVLWLLIHPTKSTTEPLLSSDILLLKEFYKLNLTNQSPAFRHNVNQWTNRLFVRMRDRLIMKKSERDEEFWEGQKNIEECYKDFLVWMLGVCWDAFYLDASYSRKHLSLQFAKDILSIFVHNQQQSQSASSGGGVLFHLDGVKTHIVQWIVSEDSAEKTEDGFVNCRLKRLMGMFHDSVQINKDLALEIFMLIPADQLSLVQQREEASRLLKQAFLFARSLKSEQYPAAANLFELISLSPHVCEIISNETRSQVDYSRANNLFLLVEHLTNHVSGMLDRMVGMKLLQATTSPIHGFLHCIYALLRRVEFFDKERYGVVIEKIVGICMSSCEIVFPVVKQVAPEGYMPSDSEVVLALHDFKTKCSVEDQASGDSTKSTEINPDSSEGSDALKPPSPQSQMPVTAQMVVFCSWRIVKEACFILADIVTKYKPNSNCAINTTQIVEITDYITKIVVESRHLGAFEKSFLALQQIVKFLWTQTAILETKIPSEDGIADEQQVSLSSLPEMWIDRVLREVSDPEGAKKFCLTRRSAGVPRYLEALLTTSPPLEMPRRVNKVFLSLLQSAKLPEDNETDRRSKIHALNIVRYLFRCSAIGQLVHTHVTDGLVTSLNGFNSMLWPVQNASNLLFAAILSRVFGVLPDPMKLTRKNCMSCTEFFTKFPTIYDVILSKLNSVLEPYLCALQSFTYSSATQSSTTVELVSGSLEYCMLTSEHLFSDSSLVSSNAVLYPVLLLLERLFVTENEDKYLPLLSITLKFLGWPLVRIRAIVARVVPNFLITLQSRAELMSTLIELCCSSSSSSVNLNTIHGALLTMNSILSTIEEDDQKKLVNMLRKPFPSKIEFGRAYSNSNVKCPMIEDSFELLKLKIQLIQSQKSEAVRSFSFDVNELMSLSDDETLFLLEKLSVKSYGPEVWVSLFESQLFCDWLINIVKSTDPFDIDINMKACDLLASKITTLRKVQIEHVKNLSSYLLLNFEQYPEQCQPNVLKLLNFLCVPEFAQLLLDCCSPEKDEKLRIITSVSFNLSDQGMNQEALSASSRHKMWACAIMLLFDDSPDVRTITCIKLSAELRHKLDNKQMKSDRPTYSSYKLLDLVVEMLRGLYGDRETAEVFALVASKELELSGISKNSSHKPDIQEDTEVLFEPTELNTYKESFHLLDTCADVIRSCLNQQRVVPTSSEETSDGVNQLRLDLNCIKLNVASSLYLQNGKMAQIVDKLKKSLIV